MSTPGKGSAAVTAAAAIGVTTLPVTGGHWIVPVAMTLAVALVVWGTIYIKRSAR